MTTKDEALKLALELKNSASAYWTEKEIPIIEKLIKLLALAEQPAPATELREQEPAFYRHEDGHLMTPCRAKFLGLDLNDLQALYTSPLAQQEPVAIEYWLQDTMESGRWVTTDNMAKATAEKMLSGEYGDVYPQGRIVEPSPPASKPLTDEEIWKFWCSRPEVPYGEDDSMEAEFVAAVRRILAAYCIKENT